MSVVHFINDNMAYSPEEAVAIVTSASPEVFADADKAVTIGGKKVAPWGYDNDLPSRVIKLIERNDVVGSNLQYNIQSAYGLGLKPMLRVKGKAGYIRDSRGNFIYEECLDERVLEFWDNNDIDGYFLEQISDMMTFLNVFSEIVVNKGGTEITSLRHLEATFSRWGSIGEKEKEITRHYYGVWGEGTIKGKPIETEVLSRYNTLQDLRNKVHRDEKRYVLQVPMPTPGRTYYARPSWWSIFLSGWYDISEMLPKFKKSLINNHLAVRYVVYISDAYWQEVYKRANVSEGTEEARIAREGAVKQIMDFLIDNKAKGGGIISTKKLMPSGSTTIEDKYIRIEAVESPLKGGEFIEDAEEAGNIISYAMGVHPDLNGATPGKSKGSMGGSNKRELFMIKQSMMRPFRDRLIKPLQLVAKFNKWPENLVFAVPEYVFTTLDQDRTGKRETLQNP